MKNYTINKDTVYGLLLLCLVFCSWFFSGCVSIPLFERTKQDEFREGRIAGMKTALEVLKASEDKDAAVKDLRALLGCSQYLQDTRP